MMEFWSEHQGQSPLYTKFGTLPGRNCAHNYHDRHQATHYPYYGEEQNQGRESSYWTLPGSRTRGAQQDYTSWTDPEASAQTSSQFPFVLERQPQQHQDLDDYQAHEARGREWAATQRAAREYERGFLREGWQKRWEPSSPVHYNREVSTKRNNSYRELEAWAARYSHSLPRRRRIEAELRGASQGLMESSRAREWDGKSGIDQRLAALQQARQSANIKELGMWDRGSRQQTPTCYPRQAPAPDTSYIKEKTGYQRRLFSQPPGYMAPPPYNRPHKSTPVMRLCDTNWEQEGKRQTSWPQPTLREQEISVDLQDRMKREYEDFTKPDGNEVSADLSGLKHRGPETDALQAGSVQNTQIERECMLSLQQPQTLQVVQNTVMNDQKPSKVIEGRKFRLNKKTGGLTIFCLVSRIVDPTETQSLPLCAPQTNIQTADLGEVSRGLGDSSDIYPTQKLSDEVDFKAPELTEQSNTSDARNLKVNEKETTSYVENEIPEDSQSNKAESEVVSPENAYLDLADSTFEKQDAQSEQPVSVKYPLWREPSFTSSRAEAEGSSTCVKANSEEGNTDGLQTQVECATVDPINDEVNSLDIKKDTKFEDSTGELVIDTTCVVKMELIPSPKKEQVHFFGSSPQAEDQYSTSPESNSQLNQDVTPNTETNILQITDTSMTELDSFDEKREPEGGGDIFSIYMTSSSISKKETLEERAERILGIPLHNYITEQQPEDVASFLDPRDDRQNEDLPYSITNVIHDVAEQLQEDTEEEQTQNHLQIGRTEDTKCMKESDDAEDQVKNEDAEHIAELEEQVSNMSDEDIDSRLETDINKSQVTNMAEDNLLEPTCEEDTSEQSREENKSVENDTQYPSQCFSLPEELCDSSLLSPSNLLSISQSNSKEGLDPQVAALDIAENPTLHLETSSLPQALSEQLQSPLVPESSPSSGPHTPTSPSPPSTLDLIDQPAEAMPGIENQDEEDETSQLIKNEISDTFEDLEEQVVLSQQQLEDEQPNNAACLEESNITDEQQRNDVCVDPTNLPEQTVELSEENVVNINMLEHQLECVQAGNVAYMKQSYMTEELLLQEASEYLADHLETTVSQENGQTKVEENILLQQFDNCNEENTSDVKESDKHDEQSQEKASEVTSLSVQASEISKENIPDSQAESNILQQQIDNGHEEDSSCLNDINMTSDQSQIDADEGLPALSEQTISQVNAQDCQTQKPQTETSDSIPPSDLEKVSQSLVDALTSSETPSSPYALCKSDTEHESLLETGSVCPSALMKPVTADAGMSKPVPSLLQLESYEESIQFPSSTNSESALNLATRASTPPHEGSESVSLDFPHNDQPQYPETLRDVVNRIRKHTAPDSENEEEEAIEQWDRDSIAEDLVCSDLLLDINSERIVFDEAFSTEGLVDVEQDPCRDESSRHIEEDTLSCSSHSSGDTVIEAEDDQIEETPPDALTETETDEDFPVTEGKRCSSDEQVDEQDKGDAEEFCLRETCTAEVESVMSETEERENEEEERFTSSELPVVSDEVTSGDCTTVAKESESAI